MRLVRRSPGLEYRWVVLINTTIAIFMLSGSETILHIAVPNVMRSLNASVVEIMWVVMGYSLVLTALLLPLARLADMKGRVRMYNLGFAVFTITSVLCGLSQSGMQLVISRLLQGVGAALLFANGNALIVDAFPSRQRGLAYGIYMTSAVTGSILGSVLGGIITELIGWRYVFFVNVPFGTFATVWAFLKLHEMSQPEHRARFDVGGMVTFPLGIASLLAALTYVVMGRFGEAVTNALFLAGITLLITFLFIERRVAEPMMDLSLFRIRAYWTGIISLFLLALSRGSTQFILSWYFQAVLHDPPSLAGLKLLPIAASAAIAAPISGRLADRFGSRWLTTLGLAAMVVGQLLIVTFPVMVDYAILAIALSLLGLGNGVFNSPNVSSMLGSVPSRRRGVAAGSRSVLNATGQSISLALAMAILSTVMSYKALAALFSGPSAGAQVLDSAAFMSGLHGVFLAGAVLCLVGAICSGLPGTEPKRQPAEAEVV